MLNPNGEIVYINVYRNFDTRGYLPNLSYKPILNPKYMEEGEQRFIWQWSFIGLGAQTLQPITNGSDYSNTILILF